MTGVEKKKEKRGDGGWEGRENGLHCTKLGQKYQKRNSTLTTKVHCEKGQINTVHFVFCFGK